MLSQKDLSLLYKIISDNSQTFSQISKSLQNNFQKENKSKIAATLVILLSDNLLNLHQRIISYYILYDLSKLDQMTVNPYLPTILEMLKKSQNKNEQIFLQDFLYNQINNYLDITVQNYLNDNTRELKVNLVQLQIQWDNINKEIINSKNIDLKKNDNIRPVIYDRKKEDIINLEKHNNLNLFNNNKESKIDEGFNFNYFNPNYLSYYPIKNNSFLNSEPIWLLPQLNHNFIWGKKDNNK